MKVMSSVLRVAGIRFKPQCRLTLLGGGVANMSNGTAEGCVSLPNT